ncbi:MAG: hypothetical protein IPH55_17020 [Betaproteobacteria bacterium]|nr:hypothetical protein [Betaproteobacteria bacterium]
MRTLSTPTGNAVSATSTRPAYLVEIHWSTITRLTTGGEALTWNGYVWAPADVTLTGLRWENAGLLSASLLLGNANQQFSALALNEGVADTSILVYAYDQSATATGDPVKVFDGVGGRCSLDDDAVTIELTTQRVRALKSPRQRITRAAGYSLLPAAGTVIRWGNNRYVLTGR